jgi:uncharacterized protein
MRARGNGDLRGKNEGVETGLAPSRHREVTTYLQRSARRGKPCRYTTMIDVKESQAGTTFAVKIHPRAKKNAMTGQVGDALKVALTAPPVDGKANDACIKFFAKLLNVPRSSVTIAAGQTSRNKVIRVAGLTAQQVRDRLGE